MNMGLWIDHRKAVIVSLDVKKEKILIIESNINKHFRSPTGKNDRNPNGRRDAAPDDIKEREFSEHLGIFYKKVISYLLGAGSILIFGPGESKGEIQKWISKSSISNRIVGIETAGKMTDRQIVAKSRKYFQEQKGKSNTKQKSGNFKANRHKGRQSKEVV